MALERKGMGFMNKDGYVIAMVFLAVVALAGLAAALLLPQPPAPKQA